MKLTQLNVGGFRSLKNLTWDVGDLNVLIGPNASGKSNLMALLEMLAASAEGRLNEYVVAHGGIGPLLWSSVAEAVTIEAHIYDPRLFQYDYQFALRRLGTTSDYRVEIESLRDRSGVASAVPYFFDRKAGSAKVMQVDPGGQVASWDGTVDDRETVLSLLSHPIMSFNPVGQADRLQKYLANWVVQRGWDADPSDELRKPIALRHEETLLLDGRNAPQVLYTLYANDREFKRLVNDAMSAAFEDFEELTFPADAAGVRLAIRWKSLKPPIPGSELSDGTTWFLYLLTVLGCPQPPSLIAIDEPEAGLHPSMFPIVAELAQDAAERTQVIFTTHSDQFLDAFSEKDVTTTVAKWEDGQTTLSTIGRDELSYWLKEYSLGSLYRHGELETMA